MLALAHHSGRMSHAKGDRCTSTPEWVSTECHRPSWPVSESRHLVAVASVVPRARPFDVGDSFTPSGLRPRSPPPTASRSVLLRAEVELAAGGVSRFLE